MKNHYRKSLLKLCIPFLLASGGDILGQTALDLAGSGNRVETVANLDVTNGFTIEFDVYMNHLQNYNGLITKGCSNVGAPLDVYVLSDGRMTVFYGNCSITGGGNPAYTFSATTWYHIAHTYDPVAGQGQLYVNGNLITTWSVGAGVGNGTVPITIGNRADNATDADAKFDNVRVWSGVRTASDILTYKDVCLTGTETGLEILYNMEEGTGTVLHDLATNNGTQDGNIIGTVAWNAGVNCAQPTAAALNFNGSNNDIIPTSVTNVPIGNSLYTIEAWIKPSSGTSSSALGIAGWGSYGSGNQVNAFRTTAQGGLDNYWWGNDLVISPTGFNLFDGNWHHVAATFDGTTRTIYVDGIVRGTDTPTGHNVSNANNLTVGKTFSGEYFNGSMDEIRIWNVARTQCQIAGSMNCELSSAQTGLALYYKFNEGIVGANNSTITVAADSSGNGNNGTLNNFALTSTISNWVAPGAVTSGVSCSPIVYTTINVNSPTICAGATATLTASGASTYTWNTGETTASISPSPTVTTNYTVTGTGTNNCTDMAVSIVTVKNPTTSTISVSGCSSVNINASTYTASGTYTQTLTNAVGCDSILTINAMVKIPTTSTISVSGCSSVNINASTYTASGTYTQTLTNVMGCDSILTINVTVNVPTTSTVSVSGCSSVNINASTYTVSGMYTQTLTNVMGCDSILTINATVNVPTTSTVNVNGCSSVNINAITYTTSGTYTQTLTNAVGCDSILTINAMVNIPTTSTISVSGCNNVIVNSVTYTTSGIYNQTLVNASGCDSILTINAVINYPTTSTININGCSSVNINAVTYTVSGTYTQTLVNASGCDSILTINAVINYPTTSTINVNGCSSVSINAVTYTVSGTYTQTLVNAAGCDSILTVNAIVNIPSTSTVSVSGCNSIGVNATTYTVSGTYTQNLTNSVGCDSTLTVITTINSLPVVAIVASSSTLCAGSTTTLTASGATSYTWSATETTASINVSPTVTTNYTVTGTDGNNCTNTDTISIAVNNCTTSINKLSNNNQVLIYPNPNTGNFTIKGFNEISELRIINELGQAVKTISLKQINNYEITLSGLEKGVYYLIGGSNFWQVKQLFIVTD